MMLGYQNKNKINFRFQRINKFSQSEIYYIHTWESYIFKLISRPLCDPTINFPYKILMIYVYVFSIFIGVFERHIDVSHVGN